ncbi:MAG: hypothetical protein IBX61_01590 [Thermoleophilia bacterium]|nr:hypothetical protein [Thermoleophilia bacterium]
MSIEKKHQPAGGKASASGSKKKSEGRPITVHSYSGFKSDERPRSFEIEGKKLTILQVKKTWQEESSKSRRRKTFFRVYAHNGRMYDIALDEGTGQWTLEPFAGREKKQPRT